MTTDITILRATRMQKAAPNKPFCRTHFGSFNFYIDRFQIRIDRVSVSQHETALLIS
jgi:hypothetical protein